MSVAQTNASVAISPEFAYAATQAVQGSDLALRQGLADLGADALRRQDQVAVTEAAGESQALRAEGSPPQERRPRARGRAGHAGRPADAESGIGSAEPGPAGARILGGSEPGMGARVDVVV